MTQTPIEIKRDGSSGLTITWRDGTVTQLSSETLRRECPCAACKEKRGDTTHAKPLTGKKRSLTIVESSMKEELTLQEIWGIGQYALGMRWADGHDTGIYPFSLLYELGTKGAAA
jgi:DUF971 family protein